MKRTKWSTWEEDVEAPVTLGLLRQLVARATAAGVPDAAEFQMPATPWGTSAVTVSFTETEEVSK